MLRSVILHDARHHQASRGVGLRKACALLQAAHHEDRCVAAIEKDLFATGMNLRHHRDRQESAERGAPLRAHKLGLRHAHHSKRQAVDLHRLADNVRVGGKAILPCLVSENDNRIRAYSLPFVWKKEPPHHRLRAQHRKIIAADHMHIGSLGSFALAAYLHSRLQIGHDS